MADDVITQELRLEAKQAIQALREFRDSASGAGGSVKSLQQKVFEFERVVTAEAQKANKTFEQQLALFEQLNAQAMSQKKAGIFGRTGGVDPFAAVREQHKTQAPLFPPENPVLQAQGPAMEAVNQRIAQRIALGGELNITQEKYDEMLKEEIALLQQAGNAAQKTGEQQKAATQGATQDLSKFRAISMASLRDFAQTSQGQGILGNFFGNYQQAGANAKLQIGSIKTAVMELNKTTGASFSQAGTLIKEQFGAIPGITNQVNQATRELGKNFEDAGNKGKKGTELMVGGINLVRLALHVLITSAIFGVIAAFTKMFSVAIEGLKKMEVSVYNLANAERALSQAGVEVTFKELEAVVDRLYEKFDGLFSRLDVQDMVADISIATKELGLTSEQIEKIAASAAAIQLRNPERTLEDVSGQLLTAILSGQTKGIRSMGVAASEAAIQQKALELGLIRVGEEASAQQKSIATLELVYEATSGDAEKLAQYQNTLTGAQQELAATWKDLLAELAQDFAPVAIQGIKILVYDLQVLQAIFQAISPYIQSAATNVAAFIAATKGLGGLNIFEKISKFTDQFKEAKEAYTDYFESFSDSLDTPTADPEPIVIDTSAAEEELEDLLKDLEKLQDKIDDTESDHQLRISRFDEDALIDRNRAIEDYNLNVLQATRAYNVRRQEANQKYRQKEEEDERKFQENMRKLQEEFLYSLEDALRERDARQVLRLIDKYNMDKEAMINENALRRESSAENHAIEQQEQRAQLEERLRVMAEEQAVKMQRMDEDSALKRSRMEEDHAIEMAELRAQMDERLLEAANKMAEEYGLNQDGAQAIYDLLKSYYGTDGSLAALTSEGYVAMLANAQGFLGSLMAIVGQYQGLMASMGSMGGRAMPAMGSYSWGASGAGGVPASPSRPSSSPGIPSLGMIGLAEGGQFIATRPTQFIAGEGGESEMVTVTPLSQIMDSTSISGQAGTRGADGQTQISVTVDLSPDLEARVVDNALEGASNVIAQVRRAKR